jgi:hypothetical protein
MRTNKLTGAALDWAVAKCEGATDEWHTDKPFFWEGVPCVREAGHDVEYTPSTDWAQGGPIIEREGIDLQYQGGDTDKWAADMFGAECSVYGDTPLIAAMRCYVASKLGDEVEPEELTA